MVEIDSNAILVEPIKSRKDAEMIRAYKLFLTRLKRAGLVPKKHVLDNKVSDAIKISYVTKTRYNSSSYHQDVIDVIRQRWPYATSKFTSLASLPAYPTAFPSNYGTNCCRKQRSRSTYYGNPMQHPQYLHTRTKVALLTTTKCHWHLWDVRPKCMKRQTSEEHGLIIPSMDGTFTPPWNIIAPMHVTSSPPKVSD